MPKTTRLIVLGVTFSVCWTLKATMLDGIQGRAMITPAGSEIVELGLLGVEVEGSFSKGVDPGSFTGV